MDIKMQTESIEVHPTLIDAPPNLGIRVIKLRKKFGWSQTELHRKTKAADQDGIGVSARRIGSIERGETTRFRYRTLDLIASSFKLSLHELLTVDLNDKLTHYWKIAPYQPTKLFERSLSILQYWIEQNTATIVIEGRSGIGKSALLSTLVQETGSVDLIWFDGNRMPQINEIFSQLNQSSKSSYLILDEDYQLQIAL